MAEMTFSQVLAPVRSRFYIVMALSVITALATVTPLIAVIDIARVFNSGETNRIWTDIVVIIVATLIRSIADGMAGLLGHKIDNDLQLHLRRQLVRHVRRLPLGWIDNKRSSGIINSVEKDVSAVHQLLGHTVHQSVVATLVPIFSLVVLFIMNWQVALLAIMPVIVTFALMAVMLSSGAGKQEAYTEATGALGARVIEYVHGIAVMKAFGISQHGANRYRQQSAKTVAAWSAWSKQSNIYLGLIDVVTSPVTVLAVMCVTSISIASQGTTVGIIAGLVLGLGLSASLVGVATNSEAIASGINGLKSIVSVLSETQIPEAEKPVKFRPGAIELRHVTFGYDPERLVLDDLSLKVPEGSMTALVGSSGSGKSTVAKLIARFYDPQAGSIMINGADLRQIATDDLYRNIGIVFQDPQIFTESLRENIRLARPDATDEEILRACSQAHFMDVVEKLDHGLDTILGTEVELSGGESQRVAIARAFLTDAPILILDEATAYADPDSEAAVRVALDELAKRRTVIVIAHRLSTISNSDQIIVLDQGRIAGQGTHEQLLNTSPIYTKLWHDYGAGVESIQ